MYHFDFIAWGFLGAIVILFIWAGYVFVKHSRHPSRDNSFTPIFGCWTETDFFSVPAGAYCVITALEDKISILTAIKSKKMTHDIDYDKLLKFEFTEELSKTSKNDDQPKSENMPDHIIMEFLDETGSVQQLKCVQKKQDKKINQDALSINNIFDYVNLHMNKNNANKAI